MSALPEWEEDLGDDFYAIMRVMQVELEEIKSGPLGEAMYTLATDNLGFLPLPLQS